MNIGLITLEGGGISTVCYGLSENLSKERVNSTIFTESSKKKIVGLSEYQKIFQLDRFEIPPRFFWFQLQNYRKFATWFKDCDIIHGVYPDASAFLPIKNKPFVVSFHSEPFSCLKSFIHSPLSSWSPPEFAHYIVEYPFFENNIRRCIKKADHIVLCSFSALEEFKRINKGLDLSKVSVIYNSIDLSKPAAFENFPVKSDEKLKILFAGRLFWQKGCIFLIKAFEKLSEQFDVRLDIYGKGPEEEKLKQFVSGKNLSDKVFFNGRVSNQFLLSQMRKSDLIVSPSFREAQSMFVLEAMASKKPVIAFDIPASKEVIIDGYNGVLAKVGDVNDLYEKMCHVISDAKLRFNLGTNAYEYIKLKHNWAIQIKKYVKLYEELL
jgi:glycosyltransferase involved in cell wall biosynthesis